MKSILTKRNDILPYAPLQLQYVTHTVVKTLKIHEHTWEFILHPTLTCNV